MLRRNFIRSLSYGVAGLVIGNNLPISLPKSGVLGRESTTWLCEKLWILHNRLDMSGNELNFVLGRKAFERLEHEFSAVMRITPWVAEDDPMQIHTFFKGRRVYLNPNDSNWSILIKKSSNIFQSHT